MTWKAAIFICQNFSIVTILCVENLNNASGMTTVNVYTFFNYFLGNKRRHVDVTRCVMHHKWRKQLMPGWHGYREKEDEDRDGPWLKGQVTNCQSLRANSAVGYLCTTLLWPCSNI